MKNYCLTALVLVLSLGAAEASAAFWTFASRPAFEAAVLNPQTIDFEGIASPGESFTAPAVYYQKGVAFSGSVPDGYYLYVIDPGVFPEFYDWGSGAVLAGPSSAFGDGAMLTVTLPGGTTAFGADLMTLQPDAAAFQVVMADGQEFVVSTQPFPERTFFGLVADAPIGSVSLIAQDGAFPLLDNFTFVQTAPLPPSLLLFSLGAIGFSLMNRFPRRQLRGAERPRLAATHEL